MLRAALGSIGSIPDTGPSARLLRFGWKIRRVSKEPGPVHLEQIAGRIDTFGRRFNALAEPFDWQFAREDLARFLDRLDRTSRHAALSR